jgi:hypothetical protein
MNLHLKNKLDIHTSSNNYEENGYGLVLDPLMISYYHVFNILGEVDLETLGSRPIMSYDRGEPAISYNWIGWGPLHTQAKSRDHKIVTTQKKVSKGVQRHLQN